MAEEAEKHEALNDEERMIKVIGEDTTPASLDAYIDSHLERADRQ